MDAAERREAETMKRHIRTTAIGTAFGFGGKEGLETLERVLSHG